MRRLCGWSDGRGKLSITLAWNRESCETLEYRYVFWHRAAVGDGCIVGVLGREKFSIAPVHSEINCTLMSAIQLQ